MPDTRTQILDLAEESVRARGYHAVSFRDIATALDVKSASIHYHFRHKQDLGLAIVDRYALRVADRLGSSEELSWPEAVQRFGQVYQEAVQQQGLQCLCGLLAAESAGLPEEISKRVAGFFASNLTWLEAAQRQTPAPLSRERAVRVQSEVQGAMLLTVSLKDPALLAMVIKRLHSEALQL
ncbi:TetR/AcrR family transcriptional regulator [Epibacterium ulvae]|uniref:TetR/AcrR family transcriptional regulator n=1 Tax=Epibacterium ulvae TaxID=1156985 RepID=UPI00248F98D0|nr:TetR/AcrR family transcriptional regulator [Epibacterium ulvae]